MNYFNFIANLEFYIFFFFIAIFIVIIIVIIVLDKKRKREIIDICEKNGFLYDENGFEALNYLEGASYTEGGFFNFNFPLIERLSSTGIGLFNKGHSKKVKNIFFIPFKNSKVMTMDYYYTVGGGKNSTTYSQTVFLYKTKINIPLFYLRPENFFDSVTAMVGFNDIDFKDYPDFSKKYYLKSNDEAGVREFFNENRIRVLENFGGWYIEANGNFIIFHKGKIIDTVDYFNYIEEVKHLLNLLSIE